MAQDIESLDVEGDLEGKGGRSMGRTLLLFFAVAVALLGGAAAGFMVVSPAVDGRLEASEAAGADKEGGGYGEGEGYASEAPAELYQIENIVVNPAQSDGLRFLLVTVAIDAASSGALADVEAREVELRDVLLRLFGAKTVAELSDATLRSALIEEVRVGIEGVIGEGTIRRVFVPQFVIQ